MEPTTIEVMRKQEENYYAVRGDYLQKVGSPVIVNVDYANRESMTEWCYKVIDFLSFNHETVEICMNYFDRFLLTPGGSDALGCPKLFQLANMACLYLAIKIHEEVVLDSKFMANLSNGLFTRKQVQSMELHILTALKWHVNPPTAFAFVSEYLQLLPPAVSQEMKERALTLCEPQLQKSVIDYNFVNVRVSTTALFAVMNSLQVLNVESVLLSHIGSLLSYAASIDHESIRNDTQNTLYKTIVDYADLPEGAGAITCGVSISSCHKESMSRRASFNGSPCGVFS